MFRQNPNDVNVYIYICLFTHTYYIYSFLYIHGLYIVHIPWLVVLDFSLPSVGWSQQNPNQNWAGGRGRGQNSWKLRDWCWIWLVIHVVEDWVIDGISHRNFSHFLGGWWWKCLWNQKWSSCSSCPFPLKTDILLFFLFLFPSFFWEKLMMIEMIYKMVCKSDTIEDMLGTIL